MRARDQAPGIGWLAWLLLTIVPGAENEAMSPLLGLLMVLHHQPALLQAVARPRRERASRDVGALSRVDHACGRRRGLPGAIGRHRRARRDGDALDGGDRADGVAAVRAPGRRGTDPSAHRSSSDRWGRSSVFTLQQIDGRVIFSAPTLVCILAYSATAIASNLAHGLARRATGRVCGRCRDRAPARRSAGQ